MVRNQRIIKHSQLSHSVLYILTSFPPSTVLVTLFFPHKVPIFQPHFCVNITVLLGSDCFVGYCTSCTVFFVLKGEVATRFCALQILWKHQSWKRGNGRGQKQQFSFVIRTVQDERGQLKICINMWCLPSDTREQRNWEEFLGKVLKCILWASIKINLKR